jgi:hypothetical protein
VHTLVFSHFIASKSGILQFSTLNPQGLALDFLGSPVDHNIA